MKKKKDPPKCLKCEKVLKWPKWSGQKSLPVELDGKKHICDVPPTDLEEDHLDEEEVPRSEFDQRISAEELSLQGQKQTNNEEIKVTYQKAADISPIPGFQITKILLTREDNQWGSVEDKKSEMDYGTGEAKTKTEGRGKKVLSGIEFSPGSSDRQTIENNIEDNAVILRKHNQRELQQ